MSDRVVLDASALLCLLRGERGAEHVRAVVEGSSMSTVNWSEVIGKLDELGVPHPDIDEIMASLPIRRVAFDEEQARTAGLMRATTRSLGLSLGDRACIALSISQRAIAISTDRDWDRAGIRDLRTRFVR